MIPNIHGSYETRETEVGVWRQRWAELEERERRFREFVEGTDDLVMQVDGSGRFIYVNHTAETVFGLTPDACLGRLAFDFIHPDDQEYTRQALAQWIQSQITSVTFENRLVNVNGTVFAMLWTINLYYDEQGNVLSINAICRDISVQKHLEQELARANVDLERRVVGQMAELRATQERLQHLITSSPAIIYSCRPDGDYGATFVSDNVTEVFGYDAQQFIADVQFWAARIHPDDAECIFGDLHLVFEEGQHTHEYRFLHGDGSYRWVHDQLRLIRDSAGRPVELVGSWQDITERKRMEEELQVFKALIENAPDAIQVVRPTDGIITYVNAAHCSLYGCEAEEHVGQPVSLLVAADDQAKLPEMLRAVQEQGAWRGTLTDQRQDGSTFPALLSCFVIQNEAGQPQALGGIVRDISELQRIEQERVALQEHVIEAQQAALRELSTPLIPISERVVIMPLIGSIDTQRAQQIMETLLTGIAQHQAEIAILDITGVQVVDTQVANALLRAAQAVKLLGARVVLTGIQPRIAQTLVQLGTDLQGIVTVSTLQAGIAYALREKSGQ